MSRKRTLCCGAQDTNLLPAYVLSGDIMHEIHHLLEAALYVDDLDRAEAFYRNILGLQLIGKAAERHVFFRVGDGVLLLFNPDETLKGEQLPAHGSKGPGHAALGIAREAVEYWRKRLADNGVSIERE